MKHNTKRKAGRKKGFAQTDYVVAIGIFILVFALVIQYVSNYFSTVGDTTNIRVMNSQATSLLDIAERGYEPGHWPNTPANDSLVVTLLHLDNSTLDSSQYGNNGTMSGSVNCSAVITGRLDKGCSLNGTNGYIEINRQVHDNFTLTLWFKTNDAGGENHWLTKPLMHSETAFVANDFGFGISANGTLAFGNGDGTSDYTVHGTTVVNDGTWHHGAVTREKSGTIRIFVDGILDKTGTGSITSLTSDSKIQIGYGDDGGGYLNGTIDEVAIWNRSLNESEIYSLWAYENLLDRIGLSTRAYRFVVVVNNSASYWKNQSQAVETIGNELVKVNFTELGYGASVPSVAVYEANGSRAGYEINGNVVTFRTAVGADSAKNFTVYFDDDSTFVEQTQSITVK